MERKKYKQISKRKVILICLIIVMLISIFLLLYKNDNFSEVDDNLYFAFYNGNEKLSSMPEKENSEDLVFSHGICDNGASILWNENEWAPLVKNLSKSKTKCSLYFKKQAYTDLGGMIVPVVEYGDGLYNVEHNELKTEWSKNEYRYAGSNPSNYISFNNELWRIIGLVNVQTESGVEQRVKIVRTDGIEGQKDFGNYAWDKNPNYTNNWVTSGLKDMLNGIYYEGGSGECYTGIYGGGANKNTCDFTGNGTFPKGLDEMARSMVDKDIIWNIGGSYSYVDVTAKMFYERERGSSTYSGYPKEWSKETDVGGKHNGIGIIYPSDYAYATNGGNLGREKCFDKELFNWGTTDESNNYQSECGDTNWLKPSRYIWTLHVISPDSYNGFFVYSAGSIKISSVYNSYNVFPTIYLNTSIKIVDGEGTLEEPYRLSVQ